jgi:hypothetical protein
MGAPNSFNVGRDGYQLTIIDSLLGPITFDGITSFSTKPAMVKLKSVSIDGRIRHRVIPDGHTGTIELDRQDSSFDTYFAAQEAAYFAGLAPSDIFITHTIQELDGTTSQFQYMDVTLIPDDAGNWKGQDKITEKLTWEAGSKIQLS